MPPASPTTPELLLDLLEFTSLGAATTRQLASDLRKRHQRVSGLKHRVAAGLEMLEAEGLVESVAHVGGRAHRVTAAGLATLESNGRYPQGGTVLFTDLVGSTALIGTFGEDEAHALRLRHFSLLRSAVATFGGREVKGLGDGLMVVFSEAADALGCAAQMQRNVGADEDGLGLRVGLHTGPLLREDDDFHGTTVIVAARLCDRCETGQILLSQDVLDAAGGAAGQPTAPVGDLDLKGLSHAVATHELTWAEGPRAGGDA